MWFITRLILTNSNWKPPKSELELEIPFDFKVFLFSVSSISRVLCTFCVPKLFSLSRKVLSKAIIPNWCKSSKMLKANSGEGRWWPELAHPQGIFAFYVAKRACERFFHMSSKYSIEHIKILKSSKSCSPKFPAGAKCKHKTE